jgi:hypothetical protein
LFRTFIYGIIFGAAVGVVVLYYVPAVDQVRELSIISVMPNDGNREVFHANIPDDRIMIGAADQLTTLPAGLNWPSDEIIADTRAELFKIRNSKDVVVGVASRIAASDADLIEWALHLPARGSLYVLMEAEGTDESYRNGILRAGTREFGDLVGRLNERWIVDTTGTDGAPAGRLELTTGFVSVDEEEL